MKEKIKIPIKDLVIKKDNIIGLAKCILNQKIVGNICFNIRFMNEQEIESDDILVFENEKINELEIKSIYLSYISKDYTKSIKIYIFNYSKDSYVELSCESKDGRDWLAVNEKDIKEQISYCDKKNKFIQLLQNDVFLLFIVSILNIFITIFMVRIIERIMKEKIYIYSFLIFMFLEIISTRLSDIFYKAFPIIEIDIKNKNNSAKKARNYLKIILGTVIVPFLLDLLFNFIENIM